MHPVEQRLHEIHARYAPVDARVHEILEHIRRDCRELDAKARNEGNERQVEAFIAWLTAQYPGRAYEVTRGKRTAPVSAEDSEPVGEVRCVFVSTSNRLKTGQRTNPESGRHSGRS